MRILITGASGFVGGHLALKLGQDPQLRIVSLCGKNPCASEVTRISEQVHSQDLTEAAGLRALFECVAPEVIIHAAALARGEACEKDPQLAHLSNVAATENIISAAGTLKNKPFLIYLSTDLVFDGASAPANGFVETDTPTPKSAYAISKYQAEQVMQTYLGGSSILRICLTYGKPIGESRGCLGWLMQGLSDKQEVVLFVDEWRTPLLADDLITVVKKLLRQSRRKGETLATGVSTLYHVAGTERISRFDFGLRVAEFYRLDTASLVAKRQKDVYSLAPRASDVSLSTEKLKRELGFCPHDIRSGLACMA